MNVHQEENYSGLRPISHASGTAPLRFSYLQIAPDILIKGADLSDRQTPAKHETTYVDHDLFTDLRFTGGELNNYHVHSGGEHTLMIRMDGTSSSSTVS